RIHRAAGGGGDCRASPTQWPDRFRDRLRRVRHRPVAELPRHSARTDRTYANPGGDPVRGWRPAACRIPDQTALGSGTVIHRERRGAPVAAFPPLIVAKTGGIAICLADWLPYSGGDGSPQEISPMAMDANEIEQLIRTRIPDA